MKKFKTSDGLNLAYMDEGQGPALLCLPGLTRDINDFNELSENISGVRLIRLDSRGRGASDWDQNTHNYSAPIEARDAVELLDHLGLEKAAIIGTSRGGILAMILAMSAKSRLSGVLLNDIGPVIGGAAIGEIIATMGQNPPYKTYDEAAQKYPQSFDGFPNVSPERWQTEVRRLWQETPDGLRIRYDPKLGETVAEAAKTPTPDLWPFFDAFSDLPLALLRGENSTLLSAETAAEMRRRRPDMLFATVKDRGHIPFLDEPESLAVINAFIGELRD
ncbi:MAG: alpha/beta hydrolase [Alphaproteobacteria bacterium]|nr:alpha/beta hydrolase [Alphaproteobacteria bacterium]